MQSLVGHELGQYRLVRELGRGSMGVVYRGIQTNLDREVAIKVLVSNLADDRELVERFLREARLAGKLSHANIVHVYDHGNENGVFYIAMELIDGKTLRQLLGDKGRFGVELTLDIAIQVCDALKHAHETGIIHRDIKPDNIMIDKRGSVKVADFGLAKGLTSQTLTTPGAFVGSPSYVSPEQLKGDPLDFRTDLYSLGRVMYRMLAGRPPFQSDDLLSLIYMEMHQPVPRFAEYGLDIPYYLENLVLKAQANNREDRFRSAEEMLAALNKVKAGLETSKIAVSNFAPPAAKTDLAPAPSLSPTRSSTPSNPASDMPPSRAAGQTSEGRQDLPAIKRAGWPSRIFSAFSYFGLFSVFCLPLAQANEFVLAHARQALVLHVFRLVMVSIVLFAFNVLEPLDVFLLATVGMTFPPAGAQSTAGWIGMALSVFFWLVALFGSWQALRSIRWRLPILGWLAELQATEGFSGSHHTSRDELSEEEREEKRRALELHEERSRRFAEALHSTHNQRARQERLDQIDARIDEIIKRAELIDRRFAAGEIDEARFDDLLEDSESELSELKEEARQLGKSLAHKSIHWVTDKKR